MNSSSPALRCCYQYDPLDRLTSHVQSDTPQRHRFYCKSRLATEIQGTIGYTIVQHDDLLLAQHQFESGSPDTTLLATDLQRSVLQTLKKNADPQPIAYSPYGHRSAENDLTSVLGFNGERPEPATGHYLLGNGYRAFNTFLMRFNSPDSLSPFGKGGLNSYVYCLGDPINNGDPDGHSISAFLRSTSAFYEALTMGTIKFGDVLYNIPRNMSTFQAMRTRKTVNELLKPGKANEKLIQKTFKTDKKNLYRPSIEDHDVLPSKPVEYTDHFAKKYVEHFYSKVSNDKGNLNEHLLDHYANTGMPPSPHDPTIWYRKQLGEAYQKRIAAIRVDTSHRYAEAWSIVEDAKFIRVY